MIKYGNCEAVTFIKGRRVVIHVDAPWDASDPAVKARPDLFSDEPIDRQGIAPVEQATAVPGEKRTTARKAAPPKK